LEALEPRTLLSSTWYVDSSYGGTSTGSQTEPFTTIQAAINAAGNGDTILVETGKGYNESDAVNTPNLTIEADASRGAAPVLDGTTPQVRSAPGFTIASTAIGVTIEGLTIQDFDSRQNIDGIANDGTLSVTDCTFKNNQGFQAFGGGIHNRGTLNVTGSQFTANYAEGGGGLENDGTATVAYSTFTGNQAAGGGGGIANSGTLTAVDLTLSNNNTAGAGGDVSNEGSMTITSGIISGGGAQQGGGIYNTVPGTMTVNGATISGNSGEGGGILNWDGALTVSASMISGNSGDGIFNYVKSTLDISDSSISANSGDGVLNEGSTATISDCTFSNNSGGYLGGGIGNTYEKDTPR
jgi:hypothetical protein